MRLAESIQSTIALDSIGANNRDQAIDAMLSQMSADGSLPSTLVPHLRAALIHRDELGPTGIGEGVAIPHVWHAGLHRVIAALAVSRKGINYPSLDRQPVHIILLILTPQDAASEPAKQILFERWLHYLRDPAFRAELRIAIDSEGLWNAVRSADPMSMPADSPDKQGCSR
jgi:mannitol/fructose-specific phosphotransferase system IIA component (Ntr-type)